MVEFEGENEKRAEGKMVRTYEEEKVYQYMVRCLFLNVYRFGEILPTQVELAEQFGVSLQVMKRAMTMLREDGFIETRKSAGSLVVYQANNPVMLERMPLYKSDPDNKTVNSYEFPRIFMSCLVYFGLKDAEEGALDRLYRTAMEVIENRADIARRVSAIARFHLLLTKQIKNCHVAALANHFFNHYLFFCSYENYTKAQKDLLTRTAEETFVGIADCIEERFYEKASYLYYKSFERIYSVPKVFAIQKLSEKSVLFPEKTLYQKILDYILSLCLQNQLLPGDVITFEIALVEKFRTTMHAVKQVTAKLEKMGLIKKEKSKGIVLNADCGKAEILESIRKLLEEKRKFYFDVFDLIETSNIFICRLWADEIPAQYQAMMRRRLEEREEALKMHPAVSVTGIITIPMLQMKSDCEIARKYHEYVFSFIHDFINLLLGKEEYEELYTANCRIIELLKEGLTALEEGKVGMFQEKITKAHRENNRIQKSVADRKFQGWLRQLEQECPEREFYLEFRLE